MPGIIASILVLLNLYTFYQWRKYAIKWMAAEGRCIELEYEVSRLKSDR